MNESKINMTGQFVSALAFVVTTIRDQTGLAPWQRPGVESALPKAARHPKCRDLGDLTRAATRAAQDPAARTPATIALDGRHWHEPLRETERPVTSGPEARFCEYKLVTDEDGQPLRCGRLLDPDGGCDHGIIPRPQRAGIIAKLRQDIAEAQGIHQRVEGERETLREKAKEDAA